MPTFAVGRADVEEYQMTVSGYKRIIIPLSSPTSTFVGFPIIIIHPFMHG